MTESFAETQSTLLDDDEVRLRKLGYKQTLYRGMSAFDNWTVTMGALYFIGGVQALFSTAISQGGPVAMWVNWIIASLLTAVIAASLAEICSTFPTAGSIYFWAYKCGGQKWGPLLSWLTAWLNVAGWIMNVAADATAGASFIVTEPQVYGDSNFPSDPDDINARSIQWGIAVVILLISLLLNLMHPRHLSYAYKAAMLLGLVLFLMHITWLPAAVANGYGFRSAKFVFTDYSNSTGFSDTYAWLIGFLFPLYTLMGFDASGHLAEETKKSHQASPNGIFRSFLISSTLAFVLVIALLFCMPDLDTFLSFSDPTNPNSLIQPIVGMYQLALGNGGQATIVIIGSILYVFNCAITMQATSRIVYAIARDKVLPFSDQLRGLNRYKQPYGALLLTTLLSFILISTILPSAVAFTSITSASVISIILSYGLVILGRITVTRESFKQSEWTIGRFSVPFGIISCLWIGLVFAVLCLPTSYPVSSDEFNYAPIILAIILLIAFGMWFISARFWFKGPVPDISDGSPGEQEEKMGTVTV